MQSFCLEKTDEAKNSMTDDMRSSQAALDLIVAAEVVSQSVYTRKYRKPEWPGASSGVTIGIGYDLGQTPRSTITSDWQGRVPDEMLSAMVSASGFTGTSAKPLAQRLRSKIDIPWDTAIAVHEECVVPRWEAKVSAALPNTDQLSPDCFGALLSLTFNRGPSFSAAGDRYREMRAIKAHMGAEEWDAIPDDFRSMKRLWPNLAGLRTRRDNEADLFAKGIKNIGSDEISSRPPRTDDVAPAEAAPAGTDTAVVTARTTAGAGVGVVGTGYALDKIVGGAGDAVNKLTEHIDESGNVLDVTKKTVMVPKPGFWYGVIHFITSPEFVVSVVILVAILWTFVWWWQRQHPKVS